MQVFAECKETKSTWYDQYSEWKYSYECNVKNLCLGQNYGGDAWNFHQDKQLIQKHDITKYPNIAKLKEEEKKKLNILDLRKIYIDTQNNIMDCAVIKSKYALNQKIIDDFRVSERSKEILRNANERLDKEIEEKKCLSHNKKDKIYNFKDVLDSLSYEVCVYSTYMHYYQSLKEMNIGEVSDIEKIKKVPELQELMQTESKKIDEEYDNVRETMETALTFYETFQKTYPAHLLLEIIEVELTEYKRYIGWTVKVIRQFVTLLNNAQVHQDKR